VTRCGFGNRDAVAAWLEKRDNDPWFAWVVNPTQERGAEYGVRIELAALGG
jgi:hypothetical protein